MENEDKGIEEIASGKKASWDAPHLREHGDLRQITGQAGAGSGDFLGDMGDPSSVG